MKLITHILIGLALIIAIFALSVYISDSINLAFPPALIGIAVLFLLFLGFKDIPKSIKTAGQPLLKHMSLFFVPAIVGILAYKDVIFAHPLAIFCAIIVSTIISLVVTAYISQKLLRSLAPNMPVQQNQTGEHKRNA